MLRIITYKGHKGKRKTPFPRYKVWLRMGCLDNIRRKFWIAKGFEKVF